MMKQLSLAVIILLSGIRGLYASEPTTPPSNAKVSNITCGSATIQWSSGDGAWNMVLVREGGSVNDIPVDGKGNYNAQSKIGTGDVIGTDNWVCYNNLNNTFTLTGLKLNTKYCVAIFGHDGGLSPDYLTTSSATICFTTNNVTMDFDFRYTDTCQNTNKVTFVNRSAVSVTGATFIWRFYNAPPAFDQSNLDSLQYTFTKPGIKKVELFLVPTQGCSGIVSKTLLIYPRTKPKPYNVTPDTQCYANGTNHFFFNENTGMDPTPKGSFQRAWYFPGDTSTIPNPDIKGVKPGVYQILYRGISLYDSRETGCYDTAYLTMKVVADPTSGVTIDDSIQCLQGNKFNFDNVYPGLVSFSWDFGDGGNASSKAASHTYVSIGNYEVIHKAASQEGCKSADTSLVLVKPNTNASFQTLPSSVCENAKPIQLKPTVTKGTFYGNQVSKDTFYPKLPGTFSVKYVVPDTFCPDSTTQSIVVNPLPRFTLGPDTKLCNGGTLDLTITATGTYLWDDGSNNATRTFSAAGDYWGQATDNGCIWRDSISMFVGFKPQVTLPPDTLLCGGAILPLHAFWPGSTTTWSTGSHDTTLYITSPGTYFVTLTNPCGSAQASMTVNYQDKNCDLFIPDAFTPNADGKNEVFQILGKGINPLQFLIFNRWGQKVFDSRETHTFGWDGTYMGQDCMDGVYTYLFYYEVAAGNFKRRNFVKGSVIVYR